MVGMSMERGGFGNVARAEVLCEEESLLERVRGNVERGEGRECP